MIKKIVNSIRRVHASLREKNKSRIRSPDWDKIRDAHLRLHSVCAVCGGSEELQVHHIVPYHIQVSLELEASNLITLCMGRLNCHLHVGHGGSFRFYNPNVLKDAALVSASFFMKRDKLIAEIKKNRKRD